MFFMIGIYDRIKELDEDHGMEICPECGRYCKYRSYMKYTCLSLFFIPVFKWGREYYSQSNCCGHIKKGING